MSCLEIMKHPVYYRDENLDHYIKKNFYVIYNNTGSDDLGVALKMANLKVFGERHKREDQRCHNALIEQIATPWIPVNVEESSDIQFNPMEGLPGQLRFINPKFAHRLNLGGWDHPEVIRMVAEAIDGQKKELDELVQGQEAAAQVLDRDLVNYIRDLLEFPVEKLSADPELFKLILDPISLFIENARNGHLLTVGSVSLYINNMKFIRAKVAESPEAWVLRTKSLFMTTARAIHCFGQTILVGGKAHFDPRFYMRLPEGAQQEILNSSLFFREFCRSCKVLILFTSDRLEEEKEANSNPDLDESVKRLDEYIKSSRIRSAFHGEIRKIIESDAAPSEIWEGLGQCLKSNSG